MENNGNKLPFEYNKNNFGGIVSIDTSSMMTIHCKDIDNIDNINPPSYKVNISPDKIPVMYITDPPQDFVITEKKEVNFQIALQ